MDIYNILTQEILERISRHCPESLSAYLQCVNRANSSGDLFLTKEMIEVDLSENWSPFKNKIKKLARENLLEWNLLNNGISITLADIYEDD